MKKSIFLGIGVCALALVGTASALSMQQNAVQTHADPVVPAQIYLQIDGESQWAAWGCDVGHNLKFHFKDAEDADITTFPGTQIRQVTGAYGMVVTPANAAKLMVSWNNGESNQNKTVWTDIPTDGKNVVTVTGKETAALQSVSWSTLPIELHEGAIYWRIVNDNADFYSYSAETISATEYKFNGVWRGLHVNKTATLRFNPAAGGWSNVGIMKIPFLYNDLDNMTLVVNTPGYDCSEFKSKDLKTTVTDAEKELKLVDGAYYYSPDNNLWSEVVSNADMGKAAALAWDLEEARNAVVADPEHEIAAYSICGIPAATMSSLVTKYAALTETQKGYFDNATVHTYSGEYGSSEVDGIKLGDMMAVISRKVAGSNYYEFGLKNDNTSAVAIGAIIGASTLVAGGFFLLRKKKAE